METEGLLQNSEAADTSLYPNLDQYTKIFINNHTDKQILK